MLATHTAKVGIVTDQVCQLAALLHQIAARQTADFLLKAGHAQQLAQHVP
jgi:hypothetical protein